MQNLFSRLNDAIGDRYRVERELGRGATAVVYLADDLKHHRRVAIKLMKPELRDAIGPERFLREIETVAGLSHPNILTVHDSGDTANLLYFVMPYVEGETLRDRLDQDAGITLDEALQITMEVADALGHAHSRGLIHRDIKPENILFQAGHAVVSDFGIARAIDNAGTEHLTDTGVTVGTVSYMSPEQAIGESNLDGRSDVYSLACVFFEMMAGMAPFAGASPQAMLAKKIVDVPPSVRGANPRVPVTVDTVITRALSREPDDRFTSAEEFADELSQANTAEVLTVARLARRRRRRSRTLAGVAGVGFLAAAGQWLVGVTVRPEVERFALLPLVNFENDPERQFLIDGLHDGLIVELQQAGMRAVSRRSVLEYRNSDHPVREIAGRMGLDAVMTGRVRLTTDSVRIELNLFDGETEESRWIRSDQDALENILELQQRITLAVAEEIQFRLTPQARAHLAQARPVDPKAYEAYLRGMTHWRLLTPADMELAMQYFERAREIDPAFALAYAGIALTWNSLAMVSSVPSSEAAEQSRYWNEKAMELGGHFAEVQLSDALLAAWTLWDLERAEASFRRAVEINPNYPDALLYLGHVLLYLDRPEEAIEVMERGHGLEPFDALYNGLYAMGLNFVGRYDDAIQVATEALETAPGNLTLLGVLKSSYHILGRHEEAIAAWEESYLSVRDNELAEVLMSGWEEGGYELALSRVGDALLEHRQTGSRSVSAAVLATIYTRAGRSDLAFEWLNKSVDDREYLGPYLTVDHIFDELRADPRFDALLEKVGLPAVR